MILDLDVDLVSPALIGGANPRKLDEPPGLRPPSVRGALRFWSRALTDGDRAWTLETELFGAIERGQRIAVLPSAAATSRDQADLFPSKPDEQSRSSTPRIALGSAFRLRFRLPADLDRAARDRFQAVLWTWLHLGTIGSRGRRGYGSLLWRPRPGDALDGFPVLDRREALASRGDLEEYLRSGLRAVAGRLGVPREDRARATSPWFRLRTTDQVFVSEPIGATYNGLPGGLEDLLHGRGNRASPSPPDSEELGRPPGGRLASPMLWRVFPAAGHSYFVVVTWSPYSVAQLTKGSEVANYLRSALQVKQSLVGRLALVAP